MNFKISKRSKILIAIALLLAIAVAAWATPKILRRLDMQGMKPVTVAKGLEFAWGLAFLPDGRMLVTERPGRMRIVTQDGKLGAPITGLPPVFAQGEGGLLDVILDPKFATNSQIFWAYSEPDAAGKVAGTAVARGRLDGIALKDVQVIYRQPEKLEDGRHFGARLLFAPDGNLFITLGDRSRRDDAQNPQSAHGKIMRITAEGQAAADNPFASVAGTLPEIWTLGHRNVQGIAFHPETGELWASEHGPQGGDELNVIARGKNYGWPVITHGCEYTTCAKIGEGTDKAGMESPIAWWGPQSTAPSGITFLTSDRYAGWKGQLFMGTLAGQALVRMKIEGHKVVEQQRIATGLLERIRDVKQGPDGWLYVITAGPEGRIIRMER
ncbi:MAG: PQQ-dependent sugar dehydrogenase [Betaproteobacteria bacterium]|nr:PQQ-dependent sugar dehydrogenase [Betaproteobacteria bacterium]